MSQPNSWHQAYKKLSDFVTEHPEIEIGASRIKMPESVRTEFYQLFNAIKTEFVEQKLADLLNEARPLSEEYIKVEGEVIKLLELEEISSAIRLHRFLHDTTDALARVLYDPLFDLLKGKIDIDTFEEVSLKEPRDSFGYFYQSGYVRWVALSLVKLLEADKSFQIGTPAFDREKVIGEAVSFEKSALVPEESKRLIFKHEPSSVTFIVPDFIIHSVRVNQFFAIRQEIGKAVAVASNPSAKREWYSLDSIAALYPDQTLIYMDDNPEEISLVADRERICRPDLVIECKGEKGWYGEETLERIKLQHNTLKPIMGTYVVSRDTVPEQAYKNLMTEESAEQTLEQEKLEQVDVRQADIHILEVGFDQSNLEPIVNALMQQENEGKQPSKEQ